MGNLHFRPPPLQNRRPLTDRRNFFFTCDFVHDFYSCAKFGGNPSMGGLWANKWNIKQNFYLYLFLSNSPNRLDRSSEFHAWWLKWRGLTQRCAFLALVDIVAYLGAQIAPELQFFGVTWVGVFQPNAPNIETFILSQLLHRSQPDFAQW